MRLTLRQRASWCAHLYKAVTQQHHRHLRPLFAPHIPANGVVIDIGAHAGQFSKLFAAMAPGGHVHAFEPSAYARSIMIPALRLNRIGNVTLTPQGLSDAEGELILRTPLKRSTALGYGTAHLGDPTEVTSLDQTVSLTTLDAFVAAHALTRVDFIKADIEGWELRALAGGTQTLARHRPALFLEVDDVCLARAGDTPAALFDWLAGFGYQARSVTHTAPAPAWIGAGDYLFTAPRKS